jgi:predicted nucleotidyltransferase
MAAGSEFRSLLDRVVAPIARIDGVRAIALGGSNARGTADPRSDVDIGVYYDSARPFEIRALARVAEELDDRHSAGLVTGFGEWGPGVNGGGWLVIGGRHVDLLYRDLRAVRDAIDECRAARPRTLYQLGHPLGFHNQIYAGEVNCCVALYDPDRALADLKALVGEYPEALRGALVEKHLFDAGFELAIADKPAARGDVMCVAGCVFRAAGFMTLVLYALNRRWFINEKGALAESRRFALLPARYHTTIEQVLAGPGREPAELADAIARLQDLLGDLTALSLR